MAKIIKAKTTALTLLDRVMMPSVLPTQGDFKTLLIVNDINNKVKISQKELQLYNVTALQNGALGWNDKGKNASFDYAFTELETAEIKKALNKLDEEQKLSVDHIGLYKAFVK